MSANGLSASFIFVLANLIMHTLIESAPTKPHIIFVLADDLGWNDVSFHGSRQIPTPHLDRLAREGVMLNSYYGHHLCSPSRASLLTGKYAMRFGMQGQPLGAAEPRGLNLTLKLLPEYLRDLGYRTNLVGKWHLGYHALNYTPTFRGFNSFFGSYSGTNDYFNYSLTDEPPEYVAFDLWNNLEPGRCYKGRYATELFTERAVDVINYHNKSEPLFLMLSHLAPHVSSALFERHQAPQRVLDQLAHIQDEERRKYAGMVIALDESIGVVRRALEARGMDKNCVIVFASDNGGQGQAPNWGFLRPVASNWPLRGAKGRHWEGGVRVVGAVWSPLLRSRGRVSNELYHVTDWLPTFYRLAGGEGSIPETDGFDIWGSLSDNKRSPREEAVITIDYVNGDYAFRWKNYKLIIPRTDLNSGWSKNVFELYDWNAPGAVRCRRQPGKPCRVREACLYDLEKDPCEFHNINEERRDVWFLMMTKLARYNASAAYTAITIPRDPAAQSILNGGLTKPWIKM